MEAGQFRVDLDDGGVQVRHDVGCLGFRSSGCSELFSLLGDLNHDENDDKQSHHTEGKHVQEDVYVHAAVGRGGGGWCRRV